MINFCNVVIFGVHPVNRYKLMIAIFFATSFRQLDCVNNLIDKVKWTREEVELMTSRNRKTIALAQAFDIFLHRIGDFQSSILSAQNADQGIALGLVKLTTLYNARWYSR